VVDEVKVWENDEAFDALHDLITDASQLTLPARQNAMTDEGYPPS
jgi:hypothetical protein